MSRPKLVLLGALARTPVGGVAWLVGQYAIGFERLGYDVHYVEAHGRAPQMFMSPDDHDGTAKAAAFLDRTLRGFGLGGKWAYHALHLPEGPCLGMEIGALQRLYADAALILNLHGATVPRPEHARTSRLVYLGTDPVPLELELHEGDQAAIDYLEPHVAFFTWGLNYGNPDCRLPWSARFPLVPSPPPVVVDLWQNDEAPVRAPFTTVGNWRQHAREVHVDGEVYRWSKHHEFIKILDLPSRTGERLELALSSYEEHDQRRLERHGWHVRPGLEISSDTDAYRRYIVGSKGELSVAKEQNVRLRTGWFSERSATYLAAGRPVVLQDTGFGSALPLGQGLFAFDATDDAAAALDDVAGDYERHSRAATEVARACLSHDVVLGDLLDHTGLPSPSPSRGLRPAWAAPVDLPRQLALAPVSRRPLRLADETVERVLSRAVPVAPPAPGRPAVSVIVVTYDNLVLSRMAIESVLANSGDVPYELVVVDNASTDGTTEYLSVLAARNRHVRVLRNPENRGFAAANNQGIEAARGDHLVLLNNDTIVTPGWLDGLLHHLADAAVGLVGPVTNRCGNEAEVPVDHVVYGDLLEEAGARRRQPPTLRDVPVAVMFCVALRREVARAVGPLDERFEVGMFEDDDYSRRVRLAGYRVVCAEDVFVHHFGEGSLGALVPTGRHAEIFHLNRGRFEAKWETVWAPHRRGIDAAYRELREVLAETIRHHVRGGDIAAVVSRGDDGLLDVPGLELWHFPRLDDGAWAGHHPADGAEALAHLEQVRRQGARWLVVPSPALWWLEHYETLRAHLDEHHRRAVVDDAAVIYELSGGPTAGMRAQDEEITG